MLHIVAKWIQVVRKMCRIIVSASKRCSETQVNLIDTKMRKTSIAIVLTCSIMVSAACAQAPDQLNDLQMAHVALTADMIDIEYAHLALAFSTDPKIRAFAETMIRDHSAVNQAIADLAAKLGVQAQDNDMSRGLIEGAEQFKSELSQLRGRAFDLRYAENELGYHQTVNGIVRDAFIPNIENAEVKAAFGGALQIFLGHEHHAQELVNQMDGLAPGN